MPPSGSKQQHWQGGNRSSSTWGDHDPSGLDMTRDIRDRLRLMADVEVEVVRLALNYDQVEDYDPPPNPTKLQDTRSPGYVEQYGEECWELDALEPAVLDSIIRAAIEEVMDHDLYDEALAREEADQAAIRKAAESLEGRTA